MQAINPFKIRAGFDPIETATIFLGKPTGLSSSYSDDKELRTAEWHVYDDKVVTNFTIVHMDGSDTLEVSLFLEKINPDHTMFGAYQSGSTAKKINAFVNKIRKPWSEWSEEEILQDVVWIALHKEDTGTSTDAMRSKMAMESYRDPSNKWVKRYFQSPE